MKVLGAAGQRIPLRALNPEATIARVGAGASTGTIALRSAPQALGKSSRGGEVVARRIDAQIRVFVSCFDDAVVARQVTAQMLLVIDWLIPLGPPGRGFPRPRGRVDEPRPVTKAFHHRGHREHRETRNKAVR